jgi:hypothetical protein
MNSRFLFILSTVALLIINAGDLHRHLCLDGQEPAVTYHYENLDGHPDHSEEDQTHNDLEGEVSVDATKSKNSQSTYHAFLLSNTVLVAEILQNSTFISIPADSFQKLEADLSLPPLRAPPLLG